MPPSERTQPRVLLPLGECGVSHFFACQFFYRPAAGSSASVETSFSRASSLALRLSSSALICAWGPNGLTRRGRCRFDRGSSH